MNTALCQAICLTFYAINKQLSQQRSGRHFNHPAGIFIFTGREQLVFLTQLLLFIELFGNRTV